MSVRTERDRLAHELAAARDRIARLEAEVVRRGRDALTGLLPVEAFRDRLADEIERVQRHDLTGTLVLLRVDRLPDVQRDCGFDASNAMLCALVEALQRGTRPDDVLARVGDDTFAVLLREADAHAAGTCVSRLLLEFERIEQGSARGLPTSAGIAAFTDQNDAIDLFERAGRALDDAQAAGGGRSVIAPAGRTEGLSIVEKIKRRDAVEALAIALLERDRYTGEHSESVVEMAASVARNLGLPETQIEDIRTAALLHDIGKVGIPDAILNKPGPLTPDERAIMAEHPVIGERILRSIGGFAPVAEIVRHEHESWDGSGYPDQLHGDRIPLGSRIILACDAYHAMTSDRPYRARMSHADAFSELSRCAGQQFDPAVTAALIGYFYHQRRGVPVLASS